LLSMGVSAEDERSFAPYDAEIEDLND